LGPRESAPVFYYDLGSPECYLAAERVGAVLPAAPDWQPVLGSWDSARAGESPGTRDSPRAGDRRPVCGDVGAGRDEFERLARARGLQPVRWPPRWPPGSEYALRAATYAKSLGRVTAFSLAAFRQAFAGGRDLAEVETVVIAAAACEMHPSAVVKALTLRSIARSLEQATAAAVAAGIRRLPAVTVGELVFEGDTGLQRAAAVLMSRQ
jgi:2-hydroxychromene-2-carboxylate isomerase